MTHVLRFTCHLLLPSKYDTTHRNKNVLSFHWDILLTDQITVITTEMLFNYEHLQMGNYQYFTQLKLLVAVARATTSKWAFRMLRFNMFNGTGEW